MNVPAADMPIPNRWSIRFSHACGACTSSSASSPFLAINRPFPPPSQKTIPISQVFVSHWDQTAITESIEDMAMKNTIKQQPYTPTWSYQQSASPTHLLQQRAYPDQHPQPLQQRACPDQHPQSLQSAYPDQHPQLLKKNASDWAYLHILSRLKSASAIRQTQSFHQSDDEIDWNDEVRWAACHKTANITRKYLPSMYDKDPGSSRYGFRDKNGITGLFAMNGADIVYTTNWVDFIDTSNGSLYTPKRQTQTP